jgi:hypothetical protein
VKGTWTPEEDTILEEAQKKLGNKWTLVACSIPGRSPHAVKNRWRSICKKNGIDDGSGSASRPVAVPQRPVEKKKVVAVTDEDTFYDSESASDQNEDDSNEAGTNRAKRTRVQHEAFDGIDFDEFEEDGFFEDGSDDESEITNDEFAEGSILNHRPVKQARHYVKRGDKEGLAPTLLPPGASLTPLTLHVIPGNVSDVSVPIPPPLTPKDIEECRELDEEAGGEQLDSLVSSFIHDLVAEEISARMQTYRGGAPLLIYDALRGGAVPSQQFKMFCIGPDEELRASMLDKLLCAEDLFSKCESGNGSEDREDLDFDVEDSENDDDGEDEEDDDDSLKAPTMRRGVLAMHRTRFSSGDACFRQFNHALAFCIAARLRSNQESDDFSDHMSTVTTPARSFGTSSPFSDGSGFTDEDGGPQLFRGGVNLTVAKPPSSSSSSSSLRRSSTRRGVKSKSTGKSSDGNISSATALSSDDEESSQNGQSQSTTTTMNLMTPEGLEGAALRGLYRTIEESLQVSTDFVAKYLEEDVSDEADMFVSAMDISDAALKSGLLDVIGSDKTAIAVVCFNRSEVRITDSRSSRSNARVGRSGVTSLESICSWVRTAVSASASTFVIGIDDERDVHAGRCTSSDKDQNDGYAVSWARIQNAVCDEISSEEAMNVSFFTIGALDDENYDSRRVAMVQSLRSAARMETSGGSSLRSLLLRDRLYESKAEALTWSHTIAVARATGLFVDHKDILAAINALVAAGDLFTIADESTMGGISYVVPEWEWMKEWFEDPENFSSKKKGSASTMPSLRRVAKRKVPRAF